MTGEEPLEQVVSTVQVGIRFPLIPLSTYLTFTTGYFIILWHLTWGCKTAVKAPVFVHKNLTSSKELHDKMLKICLFFWGQSSLFFSLIFFSFPRMKERKPALHLIILWSQVAYTSPCLLATECYQNCLAESCLCMLMGITNPPAELSFMSRQYQAQ